MLEAPYALISSTTFYTQHGDWFATVCAIISVLMMGARFVFRSKLQDPEQNKK